MDETLIQLLNHPTIIDALAHIAVLNEDYTQLAVDVGVLKSQMSQVLKLQWAVLLLGGGFVITKILTTVFNHRNGKK